jgi:outer membrane lipoprotein LolB
MASFEQNGYFTMKLFYSMLLLSLLSACAITPQNTGEQVQLWQEQQAKIQPLQHWTLTAGLIANSRNDGWHARLHWRQSPEHYRLRLNGPVGQGTLVLDGYADDVTLRDGQGRSLTAKTPQELFKKVTAIELPVLSLLDWVRGLPTHAPVEQLVLDEHGRLKQLQQQGWTVRYLHYQPTNNLWLPQKIELENPEYIIKMAIASWQF